MILYGASGHAKVVAEVLEASGQKISTVFDDNELISLLLSYPVSGRYKDDWLPEQLRIIAVGSNIIRKKIASRLTCLFGRAIHPHAVVSPSARLGEGTVVMAGVVINASVAIGKHVILNTSSCVDHDTILHDFVHLSPGAILCGSVVIGEGTHIGAGVTVIPNIRIGKWSKIGAGSVVIHDIPDFAVVVGIPGKVIRILDPASFESNDNEAIV